MGRNEATIYNENIQTRDVRTGARETFEIFNKAVLRDVRAGILEVPTMEDLREWLFDGLCPAACDCGTSVEPDGYCQHGRPSWLLAVGII